MAAPDLDAAIDDDVGDDLLRLVFISCHPVLSTEARVALTLRLLGGLTTEEIARAFLVPEPTVAQRIVRAKRTLAEARVPFEVPRGAELAARLSSVLEVIYLVFNEGYSATAGDDWMRPALCEDALRLGRILAELAPREPEVHGLVALMEIQASRSGRGSVRRESPSCSSIRTARAGISVLIRRGLAALERAEALGGARGPYALQAAIAACHAERAPRRRRTGRASRRSTSARPARALTRRGAESRGRARDGLRSSGGPRDRRCADRRSRRSRAITSCRACAATSSPSSAASTRPVRSSSAPPRSRETRASAICCSSAQRRARAALDRHPARSVATRSGRATDALSPARARDAPQGSAAGPSTPCRRRSGSSACRGTSRGRRGRGARPWRWRVLRVAREADRGGDAHALALAGEEAVVLDRAADPLGHLERAARVDAGEDDDVLVAAVADDDVLVAHARARAPAPTSTSRREPERWPCWSFTRLEVVEVHEQDRERPAAGELALERHARGSACCRGA